MGDKHKYWAPEASFVARFEDLHRRLAGWMGTGQAKRAWEKLGVAYPGDWSDFKSDPASTRKNAVASKTTAARIVAALYADDRNLEGTAKKEWPRHQDERIRLADLLHRQWCEQEGCAYYVHGDRPDIPGDDPPIMAPARPPSSAWQAVTTADFEPPAGENVAAMARHFLRGAQWTPLWVARHGSVWRANAIASVEAKLEQEPVVALHGPVGHGKSMLARQVLCDWVSSGKAAFRVFDESAFGDEQFQAACLAAGRCLILADDIPRLTTKLPAWLLWHDGPGISTLFTVQSRDVDFCKSYSPDPRHFKTTKPQSPADLDPFVDKLIEFDAGFTSDRDVLAKRFRESASADRSGGLWTAFWEATRGEDLSARIDTLVTEFFPSETLTPEGVAIAAVTFVNTLLDFAGKHPVHSRLDFEPRRSIIAILIEEHPDLSDAIKKGATECLNHIGALLADEFVGEAWMDSQSDPRIEFRSPSVTQSFNRWIFGAFSENGKWRMSRWPWFDALRSSFVRQSASAREFTALMASLNDAWHIRPHVRKYGDHGRGDADLEALAAAIYASAGLAHSSFAQRCRLDSVFGMILSRAAAEPRLSDNERDTIRDRANARFAAATVKGAPIDVILSIAEYLSVGDKELETGLATESWEDLIKSIIHSNADKKVKQLALYLNFKWYCLHDRGINLVYLMAIASKVPLAQLANERRLVDVLRYYVNVATAPHAQGYNDAFFRGVGDRHPLMDMIGVVKLLIERYGSNDHFASSVKQQVEAAKQSGGPIHGVLKSLTILVSAAALPNVPLQTIFGQAAAELTRRIANQAASLDYAGVPTWLSEMNKLYRADVTVDAAAGLPTIPRPSSTRR